MDQDVLQGSKIVVIKSLNICFDFISEELSQSKPHLVESALKLGNVDIVSLRIIKISNQHFDTIGNCLEDLRVLLEE